MGKKKKLRAIKALANKMFLINEGHNEKHWLKGSEILSWGTVKEIEGEPIDPEKLYLYHAPVMMVHNNQRRMKRAFLRDGAAGVENMFKQNIKTVAAHHSQQKTSA